MIVFPMTDARSRKQLTPPVLDVTRILCGMPARDFRASDILVPFHRERPSRRIVARMEALKC
jgi:hypothetical protein